MAMSDLLTSLLKLSAVPARLGLIAADAAVSLGKSIVTPEEQANDDPAVRFSEAVIDAAAQVLRVSLLTGRDLTFQNMLQINCPETTIRAMAEAALAAARHARPNTKSERYSTLRPQIAIGSDPCLTRFATRRREEHRPIPSLARIIQ
jgi:hypothetical protein